MIDNETKKCTCADERRYASCPAHSEDNLEQQISEAQAQIAMQAETMEEIKSDLICNKDSFLEMRTVNMLDNAISTTSETVAAWRAKETEPLRREVAALNARCLEARKLLQEFSRFLHGTEIAGKWMELKLHGDLQGGCWSLPDRCEEYLDVIDTQATALAYEREVETRGEVNALERAKFKFATVGGFLWQELNKDIAELRAANKGEVK